MKVLFLDTCGDCLDLVMRAQAAEHDCIHFISYVNEKFRRIGVGLTKVVREFKPFLKWADLIVLCDNITYLDTIDAFRFDNPQTIVFGPTKKAASWETDREVGMRIFQKHGIPIPDFKLFTSYEDAVRYVKKHDERLVCKPCGDADKDLSYVSKGPEDMLFMLDKWEKMGKMKTRFILQEYIQGIEFGVACYYGKNGPAETYEENFEHKKLMSGEIGPTTGEMGTVIQFTKVSKLYDDIIVPIVDDIQRTGMTGNIDINCIVDSKGQAWPLEWSVRMGFPSLQIQAPLFPDDPVQWMYDLVAFDVEPKFDSRVSTGVSVVLHPFPYGSYPHEKVLDFPIFGLDYGNLFNSISPYQVQAGAITDWRTAGDYVLVATGRGSSVKNSAKKAYETIEHIHIPGGMMYRDDIGEKVVAAIPELQKHGYAVGFK